MHHIVHHFFSKFFALAYTVFLRLQTRLHHVLDSTLFLNYVSSSVRKKTGLAETFESLENTSVLLFPTYFDDFSLSMYAGWWDRASEVTIIYSTENTAQTNVPHVLEYITVNENSRRRTITSGRFQIYLEDNLCAIVNIMADVAPKRKLVIQFTSNRQIVACKKTQLSIFVNNFNDFDYKSCMPSAKLENLSIFGSFGSFTEKQLQDISSILLCTPTANSTDADLSLLSKFVRHRSCHPLERIQKLVKRMYHKGTIGSPFSRKQNLFMEEDSDDESIQEQPIQIDSSDEESLQSID